MTVDDVYGRLYITRERLTDYLEGPRSLKRAERQIGEATRMIDGLLQDLHAELRRGKETL